LADGTCARPLPRKFGHTPGMHRIMFGGKGFTVDMGAYEYVFNELKWVPAAGEMTLTWSSVPYTTYKVLYSHDLLTWHLADEVPSSVVEITSWTEEGTKTGMMPYSASRRFYRILENP
jgi:hypothetical protein